MRCRRRRAGIAAIGVLLLSGCLAAIAVGGVASLNVTHDPPLLRAVDIAANHDNLVAITAKPHRVVFTQQLDPISTSDEACMDSDGSSLTMECRAGGITRLHVMLGDGNDELSIDLDGLVPDMAQRGRGGSGMDTLTGRAGGQRLSGGDDNDVLRGGPGDDLLLGGEGTDFCRGGRGHDVLRGCEE